MKKTLVMPRRIHQTIAFLRRRPRPLLSFTGLVWGLLWVKLAGVVGATGVGVGVAALCVVWGLLVFMLAVIDAVYIVMQCLFG